jgi:hypothetical protein
MSAEPLAIAALVLSLSSFAYTWFKDRNQNSRWDALNLARFAVRDLEFVSWRELSASEYQATTFGYSDPFVTASPGAGILGGAVRVPVSVAAYDKKGTGETALLGITVPDVRAEIVKRGRSLDEYLLTKHYRLQFALENVGSTSAHDVFVEVTALEDGQVLGELTQPSGAAYAPGEKFWAVLPLTTSIDQPFPHQLTVKLNVSYRDTHGNRHRVSHLFSYDRSVGTFRRS